MTIAYAGPADLALSLTLLIGVALGALWLCRNRGREEELPSWPCELELESIDPRPNPYDWADEAR